MSTETTPRTPAAERRPHRVVPRPSTESQAFWDACARHELVMQRCGSCGRFWFPPSNRCQHCWSDDFAWQPLSGRATVHAFTVYHRAYAAELADQLPYVVAVVEVEEGPRLITNVVGCDPDDVHVGMAVEVTYDDLLDAGEDTPAVSLHAFRPAGPAPAAHPHQPAPERETRSRPRTDT
jgi:uncharacterized protein